MNRVDRTAVVVGGGAILVVAMIVLLSGWTGPDQSSAAVNAIWVLLTSGSWAALWLFAAMGFGWPLRMLLFPNAREGLALQAGLGVAALLFLDGVVGALGWMQAGGAVGAWLLIALGSGLVILQAARSRGAVRSINVPPWLVWTAAPALAVLLTAACSAPGWLWASEFGGYDALSYHLQLPKEWFFLGRIEPLHHNVYSFLPGYVEAAYYHIMVLVGDPIAASYACQFLHAGVTVIAAVVVSRVAARLGGPMAGAIAAVLLLATPWVIVVGSLAYDEMFATLMLATGLLAMLEEDAAAWRRGAAIGVLAGAACAAKLTSIGFVALPLGVLLAITLSPRRWFVAIAACAIAGFVVLLPWLLRNQIHAGNPVFPFATNALGLGHWIIEQSQIWSHGHRSDLGFGNRLIELWNQFVRYGWGVNPYQDEPWKPQWSVIPWLGFAGLITGLCIPRTHRWSAMMALALLIQIAFWLYFTHLKSRFLFPAVVPLSIAGALGIAQFFRRGDVAKERSIGAHIVLGAALLAIACAPAFIYRTEAGGLPAAAIDAAEQFTGESLSKEQQQELGTTQSPVIAVNHLLPAGSRVLLVGDAAPFYYRLDRIAYQTTWDRGSLSRVMRQYPDESMRWLLGLREMGFTHILVDPSMLARWEHAGWNDPLITANRVMDFANRHATIEFRYPNGIVIARLQNAK